MSLLAHLFDRFVQIGELQVDDWHGQRHVFRGSEGGPAAAIALSDPALGWRLVANPELHAAEAYMDGTLKLVDGSSLGDFLSTDGYAFVHSIGRTCPPGSTAPFLQKYIFPGGYTPALSETLAAIEECDLWCADVEVLRLHCAYTIHHWRERFRANRDKVRALYDERFCRMREFYLTAVETSFTHGDQMVFQLLLSPSRDAVPINRDLMFDAERRLTSVDRRVDA